MSESEPQPEEEPVDPIDKLRRFEDAWAAMEYMDGDRFGSHDGESVVPRPAPMEIPEQEDDEVDREAPSPFVFRFDVSTERGVTEQPQLAPKAWADRQFSNEAQPNYWQSKRDEINRQQAQSPVTRRIVASAQEWADEQLSKPPAEMPEAAGNRIPAGDPVLQQGVPFMRGIDPGPSLLGNNPKASPANTSNPASQQDARTRYSFEPGSQPISQPYTAAQTAESEQMLDLNVAIDDFGNEVLRFAQTVSWSIRMVNAQLSEITRALQAEGSDYQ
jgi:hypothetical protein